MKLCLEAFVFFHKREANCKIFERLGVEQKMEALEAMLVRKQK